MPALILTIAVAYLAASAVLSLATIGRPRRAFGVQLSLGLTLLRVGLAVAVLGVLLTVVADSAGAYPTPGATPTTHATVTTPPPVKPPSHDDRCAPYPRSPHGRDMQPPRVDPSLRV